MVLDVLIRGMSFGGKVNNKIQTRDTMPEIHTTNELYRMAVQDFNERCDEIEKKNLL